MENDIFDENIENTDEENNYDSSEFLEQSENYDDGTKENTIQDGEHTEPISDDSSSEYEDNSSAKSDSEPSNGTEELKEEQKENEKLEEQKEEEKQNDSLLDELRKLLNESSEEAEEAEEETEEETEDSILLNSVNENSGIDYSVTLSAILSELEDVNSNYESLQTYLEETNDNNSMGASLNSQSATNVLLCVAIIVMLIDLVYHFAKGVL